LPEDIKRSGFGRRIGEHVDNYWPDYLFFTAAGLQAISLFLLSDSARKFMPPMAEKAGFYGLFVTAASMVVIGVMRAGRNKKISILQDTVKAQEENIIKLKEERSKLEELIHKNSRQILDGYLAALFAKLTEGKQSDGLIHDRITIYVPYGDYFVVQGRHATNPTHDGPNPRLLEKEGCTYEIWKDGWFFDNNFVSPENDRKRYRKQQNAYFQSMKSVDSLSMKARLYAGIRIRERQHHQDLAVLLVESTSPSRYNEKDLKAALTKELAYLSSTMVNLREHLPTRNLDSEFLEGS